MGLYSTFGSLKQIPHMFYIINWAENLPRNSLEAFYNVLVEFLSSIKCNWKNFLIADPSIVAIRRMMCSLFDCNFIAGPRTRCVLKALGEKSAKTRSMDHRQQWRLYHTLSTYIAACTSRSFAPRLEQRLFMKHTLQLSLAVLLSMECWWDCVGTKVPSAECSKEGWAMSCISGDDRVTDAERWKLLLSIILIDLMNTHKWRKVPDVELGRRDY